MAVHAFSVLLVYFVSHYVFASRMDLTTAGVVCTSETDFVISGWCILRHEEAGAEMTPRPHFWSGWWNLWWGRRSGPPRQFHPQKKSDVSRNTEKSLFRKHQIWDQKLKVLGSNFFLDGSTPLISLDDFPGEKSGERSRKTEKFLHKKNLSLFKIIIWLPGSLYILWRNYEGIIHDIIHSTFHEGIFIVRFMKELFIVRFMKELFVILFIVRFMKELFMILFIVRFMKELFIDPL